MERNPSIAVKRLLRNEIMNNLLRFFSEVSTNPNDLTNVFWSNAFLPVTSSGSMSLQSSCLLKKSVTCGTTESFRKSNNIRDITNISTVSQQSNSIVRVPVHSAERLQLEFLLPRCLFPQKKS